MPWSEGAPHDRPRLLHADVRQKGCCPDDQIEQCIVAAAHEARPSEFRLIFVVSFAIFLMVAVVERVLPSSWRSHAVGPDGGKSIFGEARAAAHTFVPFAFMG